MRIRGLLVLLALASVSAPALAADDAQLKRGRLLYLQCRACHDTQPATVQKVGPNLHGVVGRAAASAPDYASYSDALTKSGIFWTTQALERWLERPSAMVPGTTMAFAGITSGADRAALVAFLEHETSSGAQQAGH